MSVNYPDKFLKALEFTLKFEGGYVNHPYDKGGPTMKGITQKTYDDYCRDKKIPNKPVKDISEDEIKEIYYMMYYIPAKCHQYSDKLSLVVFDTAVHSGVNRALKFLLDTDNPIQYITLRRTFLKKIATGSQQCFLKGWLNRCNSLQKEIESI